MEINNETIFITGANRGLGLAFAREAVRRGAKKVYAGMRNTKGFDEPGVVPIRIDVTDPTSVAAAAEAAADTTILINNAGIAALIDNPLAVDFEAQSKALFDTNYYGVARVTQAFEPGLSKVPRAAIINVLSDIVWLPRPYLTPYAASKAAAWSYTNQLRFHLAGRSIQVLALHVGFLDTDLTNGIDVPKTSPVDVAIETYDALSAGKSEVMADKGTVLLKSTLADEVPGYITPPPGLF
ncbi:SDR family oxidoreductase [Rhizobium ruizarguesonis]|jgi:NAD(P)-dependent dehydrogenase (short-subunit alcohol dehydrogenase family)|uniref:SDR family NAD(P)-dependent oxidoreductase n=1 Tax=Rhizobium ruizarguesonis TaxID=2081791 RepID=A0AAE5BX45_9HYPH|nr:SDR family oxidoreductase [Rhizobium ruizarguesonis]MBY5832895.1 SDR family oxidoreductase [Rhizobium leguminosarum]NKL40521.1 SDR family NAD(P)-dependent oxidoreductase [Rhizobium leguminosarum bv. viciae]MBY5861444.1 SDR family oxidoreductase [Rhizobium leguminosarum]MBY5872399.1 SDR family oxidoreductase [Rhizobium leguminosarum]NEH33744.1 SDR family NAD(P)-dependent oxidoreductase [Rhizobium ruizarguesonis]